MASDYSITTSIHSLTEMIRLVQVKLDRENYLIWRTLMTPILKSHDVYDHCKPNSPIPPTRTLDPSTNTLIPNPEYKHWNRVDCIVQSCIFATVTEPIMNQLIGLERASDIWNYLEVSYMTESMARVPELRRQLETLQKGNLSMDEYYGKIIRITNVLHFIRQPLSDRDLIISTFRGLGPEYQSFVETIMASPTLPKFIDLRGLLMAEEVRLQFLNL